MFIILAVFLMLNLSFVLIGAELSEEELKIAKAYECLENETIERTCEALTLEEKIFSLLAIGECEDEVIAGSYENKCWPESNCGLKETAQAILALEGVNKNTEDAEEWLLSQNTTISDLIWYLQIESNSAVSCSVSYSGSTYNFNIGEDKKIASNAGSCLSLAQGSYWLEVSNNCYDLEYEISCDSGFLTSLLFKKPSSDTIHVLEETSTAAAGGITTEKIDSLCFEQNGLCDYEGSLWSALVLDFQGYDVSSYLPYLVTMVDEYPEYLPESFLYLLTGQSEFRTELLYKQKSEKWWSESGDSYYDTALALYPFQYEDPMEKINSMNWLLEVQDEGGCWQNNLRNTAFILYSIWPENHYTPGPIDDDCIDYNTPTECEGDSRCEWDVSEGICEDITNNEEDCENLGYFCESRVNCADAGGDVLSSYSDSCTGLNICCNEEFLLDNCIDQGGEVCESREYCKGGDLVDSFGSSSRVCCVGGTCEVLGGGAGTGESECEENSGECRTDCLPSEKKSYDYSCDSSSHSCCVEDNNGGNDNDDEKSYLWLWIFSILVILVLIAILFNKKLKIFWMKIKNKSGKDKKEFRPRFGSSPGPRPGPGIAPGALRRSPQGRRIIPSRGAPRRRPMGPRTTPRKREEVDDVLKKLKDMSK